MKGWHMKQHLKLGSVTIDIFVTQMFSLTHSFFLSSRRIVFFGFAQAYAIVYHSKVENFRTLGNSLMSLCRALLGDFDFVALQDNSPFMGACALCMRACEFCVCAVCLLLSERARVCDQCACLMYELCACLC